MLDVSVKGLGSGIDCFRGFQTKVLISVFIFIIDQIKTLKKSPYLLISAARRELNFISTHVRT
jgi:hypothetical protein